MTNDAPRRPTSPADLADLTPALARAYLKLTKCPRGIDCKERVVFGACDRHMTPQQRRLHKFLKPFIDHTWEQRWDRAPERYWNELPISRVGSGEVTSALARGELRNRDRECGRPKTTPGPCTLEVAVWADGCRHHLTPAELDARTIANVAWTLGFEAGERGASTRK